MKFWELYGNTVYNFCIQDLLTWNLSVPKLTIECFMAVKHHSLFMYSCVFLPVFHVFMSDTKYLLYISSDL